MKIIKRKAFSVAEAMIALLIGSLALGMAAPMITKQIKQNNMADVQYRLINNKNNVLIDEIKEIKEKINLIESSNSAIPSTAVMYFDSITCPDGWEPLSNKYSMASGAFIRNLGEKDRTLGSYQNGAVPDIQLALRVDFGNQDSLYKDGRLSKYGTDDNGGALTPYTGGSDEPMYNMSTASDIYKGGDLIKSDVYNKDVTEVRPNNIALLACRKK